MPSLLYCDSRGERLLGLWRVFRAADEVLPSCAAVRRVSERILGGAASPCRRPPTSLFARSILYKCILVFKWLFVDFDFVSGATALCLRWWVMEWDVEAIPPSKDGGLLGKYLILQIRLIYCPCDILSTFWLLWLSGRLLFALCCTFWWVWQNKVEAGLPCILLIRNRVIVFISFFDSNG